MSVSECFGLTCRRRVRTLMRIEGLVGEARRVLADLGTVLLVGLCLAGLVIIASTFDGDLQGRNEIVAAILGTLSLFAILAGIELADRLRGRRFGGKGPGRRN